MQVQRFSLVAVTLASALGLAACDRPNDDRTVGQKVDSAIAKTEQKADQAGAEIRKETEAARNTTGQAVDSAGSKLKDAAITTGINAELTRDASLSALKIDVDTSAGKVSLRGTAPDAASRDRATELARKVDGVTSVDNQLEVRK